VTRGLVVDLFAGGGGASTGLEAALGRPVDIAINHDAVALAAHRANHPHTRHLQTSVWDVKPLEATGGRPVAVLWASPDCTHFSVAKGGKPREQKIRSLAWVVCRWAKAVKPAVIFLENVGEFRGWGPLGRDNRPIKARQGETFHRWRRQLERLGYAVDYQILDASRYGAPTRRRRLFLVARADGLAIRWPEATHGPGLQPVRTAAECIDWARTCPSIFERKRPLASKTLWRIAQGIRRFVVENPEPFIVKMKGEAHSSGPDAPLPTITAQGPGLAVAVPVIAGVGGRAGLSPAMPVDAPLGTTTSKADRVLVTPALMKFRHDSEGAPVDAPMPTLTAGGQPRPHRPATGNPIGLMVPALVEMNHSNAPHGADEPLGTVTTQGNRFNVVAPVLATIDQQGAGAAATDARAPLPTTVAKNRHALLAPSLVKVNHGKDEARAEAADAPLSTVTATQRGHAVVAPVLAQVSHGEGKPGRSARRGRPAHPVEEALPTVTGSNDLGLTAATLVQVGYGEREGQAARALDLEAPLGTVVAQGLKHALCAAFMSKAFAETPDRWRGASSQALDKPAPTITARDHNNLAAVALATFRGTSENRPGAASVEEPLPTISAGGIHVAEVRAFLTAYYGDDQTKGKGQSVLEPMRTLTAKARLGLVTVHGVDYQIVDIGMRMLEPDELLRAQFGRFAAGYDLSAARTKAGKVRLIGNSVCPEAAEAIVRANLPADIEAVA
jgi:DNA (cytosine-5)-methyltransferase 1